MIARVQWLFSQMGTKRNSFAKMSTFLVQRLTRVKPYAMEGFFFVGDLEKEPNGLLL